MANHKSAKKRIRRNDRFELVNKIRKNRVRTFIKKVEILNNYWTRPALIAKELMSDKEDHICINGLKVEHFKQTHGNQTTTGYIFDSKIAYSTDFNHIEVNILESLKGINLLWIIFDNNICETIQKLICNLL